MNVGLAAALRERARAHLAAGGRLAAPGLWQALAGTLLDYFGEAPVLSSPKNPGLPNSDPQNPTKNPDTKFPLKNAERREVNQFFDWLERLATLESRARSIDLRAGTGGKAEQALAAWRAEMAGMVGSPLPCEEEIEDEERGNFTVGVASELPSEETPKEGLTASVEECREETAGPALMPQPVEIKTDPPSV